MTEAPDPDSRPASDAADTSLASLFFRRLLSEEPTPAPGLAPGKQVGEFRLVRLIGQGGMGQVWEATQRSLGDRRVALKFVRPERVTEKQLEYFQREARAGGRLSHQGIVAVYGYGEDAGLAWIAMEYVDGGVTLRDAIDQLAREDEVPAGYDREVARLVSELADALQAAHDVSVIHRDLKPQNILVTRDNNAKVTDFGLARITDETALSHTGDFAGTYFYMSPEQVAARRAGIDHRSDVFSLGVVLYELLALRRPFLGDTSHQVAAQILAKDPPDPRTIRSRIPRELVVIAGKTLEKDPDRRYASMAELAADLRRFLSNEPILAQPPTRWDRLVKWTRRNPTKSVASAVVMVAFVAISLLLGENVNANKELDNEVTSVKRLSALQKLDDLIAEADDLETMWPAYPSRIPVYEAWTDRARSLLDELPLHYAKRDELRALARPRTNEERAKDREARPEYTQLAELEQEIARQRRALQQRRGDVTDEAEKQPNSVDALDVAARMELAEVLFAAGRDDEALEAAYAALDAADEEQKEAFEARYQKLEERVTAATSAEGLAKAQAAIAALEQDHHALDVIVDERRDWRFPEEEEDARWWHNQLTKLIDGLEKLTDEESGLLAAEGGSPEHGWSVPRRLAFARELQAGFAPGGEHALAWERALLVFRDAYPGLALTPQTGLVPIGPDPVSGLWEFAHLQTGEPAVRGEDGQLVLTDETGLVLVLIPGGTFLMGAQSANQKGDNYDPQADSNESPVHRVTLSPYFLSKYEMTQGQWLRATGWNHSWFRPPWSNKLWPRPLSLLHPVENVSWFDCFRELPRMDLILPTEAQWEFSCRAGTSTPWWTGLHRESLKENNAINIADQSAARAGAQWIEIGDWPELDDGWPIHAPVGSYSANNFGLHETHGNVVEWVLDGYRPYSFNLEPILDPVADWKGAETRYRRGGSYGSYSAMTRSSVRLDVAPGYTHNAQGVRPARPLRGSS